MDSLNHYFDISERKIFLPGGLDTFLLIRRCFARRRGGNTLTEGLTSTAHSDGFARRRRRVEAAASQGPFSRLDRTKIELPRKPAFDPKQSNQRQTLEAERRPLPAASVIHAVCFGRCAASVGGNIPRIVTLALRSNDE
jgi:hypothetical protein